jgi:hypothetical protein
VAAARNTCIQSMPMTGMGTRSSDPAGALISSDAVWIDNMTEVAAAAAAKAVSNTAAREGTMEQISKAMTANTKYCTSTLIDLNKM